MSLNCMGSPICRFFPVNIPTFCILGFNQLQIKNSIFIWWLGSADAEGQLCALFFFFVNLYKGLEHSDFSYPGSWNPSPLHTERWLLLSFWGDRSNMWIFTAEGLVPLPTLPVVHGSAVLLKPDYFYFFDIWVFKLGCLFFLN